MDIGTAAVPWFDNHSDLLGFEFRIELDLSSDQVVVLRNLAGGQFFLVLVGLPSFSVQTKNNGHPLYEALLRHIVASLHEV